MAQTDERFSDFDEFELPYDMGEVDLSGLIPAGSYLMEIADVKRFLGEGAEYASTVVTFRVIDVDSTDEDERNGVIKRQIKDWLTDDPAIDWKMTRFMESVLGHAPTGRKVKKSELVGRRCVCDVTVREYTNKKTNEQDKTNQVKTYYKASFWQSKATDSDVAGGTEIDGI